MVARQPPRRPNLRPLADRPGGDWLAREIDPNPPAPMRTGPRHLADAGRRAAESSRAADQTSDRKRIAWPRAGRGRSPLNTAAAKKATNSGSIAALSPQRHIAVTSLKQFGPLRTGLGGERSPAGNHRVLCSACDLADIRRVFGALLVADRARPARPIQNRCRGRPRAAGVRSPGRSAGQFPGARGWRY